MSDDPTSDIDIELGAVRKANDTAFLSAAVTKPLDIEQAIAADRKRMADLIRAEARDQLKRINDAVQGGPAVVTALSAIEGIHAIADAVEQGFAPRNPEGPKK